METTAEAWNAYWTQRLGDEHGRRRAIEGGRPNALTSYVSLLRQRNVQRILLPGNGCFLLSHALVHLGFDVVVVDISPVANEFVSTYTDKLTQEQLGYFLPEYSVERENNGTKFLARDRAESLLRVAREARPGGSLSMITADLLEWDSPEPFDLIYDDRFMMILPQSDWPEMGRRYYRWLSTEGICIVETINLGGMMCDDVSATRTPFEDAFTAAGFQDIGFIPSSSSGEFDDVPPFVPPPGQKLVCFWHGSG